MNQLKRKRKLEEFLIEDIGDHDYSSDFLFPEEQWGRLMFTSKAVGIFCGEQIILEGYHLLHPDIHVELHVRDGEVLSPGKPLATVEGPIAELLKGERVILNLIQRMSGITTSTHEAVQTLADENIRICDTRKTTPGLRAFEKYAVRTGGGFNHRNGLYDAVMLKDNHISFFGSIKKAVAATRAKIGHMVKIEVETETEQQVLEAVEAGVDCIMFDNRSPAEIEHLSTLVPPYITKEASGGITSFTLSEYRGLDLDYISLGYLTHSATALDFSARVTSMKEGVQ
jgi:nicotinate-nucleotide pyrophosphorylase (carboxylating)